MVRLAENAGYGFDKLERNWYMYNKTKPDYQIEFDSIISKFFIKEKKSSGEFFRTQRSIKRKQTNYWHATTSRRSILNCSIN